MPQVPILLKGGANARTPIRQYSKKSVKTKQRSINVKEKNDVQTTAALLRICQQGKSPKRDS